MHVSVSVGECTKLSHNILTSDTDLVSRWDVSEQRNGRFEFHLYCCCHGSTKIKITRQYGQRLSLILSMSNWCFWVMDVEKNFTSSLDREENKPFSFGRCETQKITWRDNPPIKVTLFWSRHESKKVTGTGHYAWTSWRTQEAGKTRDAMAWQHQGSNRPTIGRPKRSSTI